MKKKKISTIIIVTVVSIMLSACGSTKSENSNSTTVPTTTESATESTTTETETEASTEGTTEEPTTTPSTEETTITPTTQAPTTQVPTTQAPTQPVTQAPTKPVETEPVTQAPTQPVKPTEAPTKVPEPTKPVETKPTQTPTEAPTKTPEPTKPAVKLTGITATVSGTFYVGDTLKASDFTVTAKYSDGTTKTNLTGWSADPLTLKSTSNKITVTYSGFTTTVTVAAKEKPKANTITTVEGTTKNLNDYTIMNIGGATRTYSPDKSIWYETYEYCDPWSQEYIYKYSDGKWYDEYHNIPIFSFTESNYKNKVVTDKILDLEDFDVLEYYNVTDFEWTYYAMVEEAAENMAAKKVTVKYGDVTSRDKYEFEVQNIIREMCGSPRLTWDDQMYKDIQHHSKRVYEHDYSDGANPHRISSDFEKDEPDINHGAWENTGGSAAILFGSRGHRTLLLSTRTTYGAVSYYKYEFNEDVGGVFWYSKNR